MQVSELSVSRIINEVKKCTDLFINLSNELRKEYVALNSQWNDSNYHKLGSIIYGSSRKTALATSKLTEITKKLEQILAVLNELNEGSSGTSFSVGFDSARTTNQTFTNTFIDGREVSVFDHPSESAYSATIGQGHCVVNGQRYTGTCGDCAVSTILRRSGIEADETAVVTYASSHRGSDGQYLCGAEGATSVSGRSEISEGFGLEMRNVVGSRLSNLADEVESGHGVIIAVHAGRNDYNPNGWYSNTSGGHAIVLNSVARDINTGEIVGYYVLDSNARTPEQASIFVDAPTLERAYSRGGRRANVTSEVIW